MKKDLLKLLDLSKEDIVSILNTADRKSTRLNSSHR